MQKRLRKEVNIETPSLQKVSRMVNILGDLDEATSAVVIAGEEIAEAKSILGVVNAITLDNPKLQILYTKDLEEHVKEIVKRVEDVLK